MIIKRTITRGILERLVTGHCRLRSHLRKLGIDRLISSVDSASCKSTHSMSGIGFQKKNICRQATTQGKRNTVQTPIILEGGTIDLQAHSTSFPLHIIIIINSNINRSVGIVDDYRQIDSGIDKINSTHRFRFTGLV